MEHNSRKSSFPKYIKNPELQLKTKNFILDNEARMHSFCHANQKYHVMGVMLSAAGALDWFVTKILEENDFTTLLNNIDIYHKDSLVFLPYLSGERSPINDPFAKSVIYGASLETNKSTMLKAIIEGICLGLKDCYKTLEDLNIKEYIDGTSFCQITNNLY